MVSSNLLRGEKVRLTALTSRDVDIMAHWWEDSYFLRHYATDPAVPRSAEQLSRRLDPAATSPDVFLFVIRLLDGEDPIGLVEFDGINWAHRTTWFSIGIGDAGCRGCGYGTEASALALGFAFNELNFHRVTLSVFEYNPAAIAIYEKLGFVREGTYREFIERDGRRYDMYLYGLLRPEWRGH
jgi:RimJ/RimL family protein N-acetyltransferase